MFSSREPAPWVPFLQYTTCNLRHIRRVYDVAMNSIEAMSRDQLAARLKLVNRARMAALVIPFAGIAACMAGMAFGLVGWQAMVVIMAACVILFGALNSTLDKQITAILDIEERTAEARVHVPDGPLGR